MIGALFALGLLLAGCLADPGDDQDPPETRTAQRTDPRCAAGGHWNDSLAACEYPDLRPMAPPSINNR